MGTVVSRIDQAGRISVSAQQRRVLGLESGSPIIISVVGNELRIRSVSAAMSELQSEAGQFLQNEAASVDAFIARRRSDWDDEEQLGPTPAEMKPEELEYAPTEPKSGESASAPARSKTEKLGAAPTQPKSEGKSASGREVWRR